MFKNAPAGLIYPGDADSLRAPQGSTRSGGTCRRASASRGTSLVMAGWRFSSAYGVSYDFPTAEYQLINANSPPFGNRSLVEDPPGGFDNPYAHLGGDPHPILTTPDTVFIPFGAYGATAPDINSPRIQQWNVTFEKQIGKVWQASASYLGSYTDRLWGQVAVNPGVYLGSVPARPGRPLPDLQHEREPEPAARVLVVRGESGSCAADWQHGRAHRHRYADVSRPEARVSTARGERREPQRELHDLALLRRRDDTGGGFPQIANGFTNPADPAFDRGHCVQDRTHIGSFTAGAQTPQFAGRALRLLASDWRVSGIFTALSGSWLNIITGRDNALSGIQMQRVDQVSDDVYGEKTLARYLNPAAFAQPAPGALGSYVRNSIRGPAYWTVDIAVSRQVSLGTARSLELRVEAFNLFNTFNWGNPVTNFNSGSFGRITSMTGSPRIMQFGVKYGF